jgi:hypothetical protein
MLYKDNLFKSVFTVKLLARKKQVLSQSFNQYQTYRYHRYLSIYLLKKIYLFLNYSERNLGKKKFLQQVISEFLS